MKLNEEIHDVLYGLKLYSYGIPYSENVRKYASHFYSNLFIKSQDTAIELLILNEEPKKQEKPQDVSKAGRSEKKNKHKKRKESKKKQLLSKDTPPSKNKKDNENTKKAGKDVEEEDYAISDPQQDLSVEVGANIDHR